MRGLPMLRFLFIPLFLGVLIPASSGSEVVYDQDFEGEEIGEVPSDFLILEGNFAVRQEEGNRLLELPGTPLDSFAFLFGTNERAGFQVSARIRSERTKRRFPSFGIGLGGVSGFKLRVDPNKRALEILKREEESVVQVPYEWKSGGWTWMKFQIRKTGDSVWTIEGKAWDEEAEEPADWMISHEEASEPVAGKFSVWGKPFSEKPIQYDDLKAVKVE